MDRSALSRELKQQARQLGFARVGITTAIRPPGYDRFREWLRAGYGGTMRYLEDRADAYGDPNRVLDGARSIVMLLHGYRNDEPTEIAAGQGRVARYAWGSDYHDVIHERLHRLADWFRAAAPGSQARGVVDTAPLAEREFAQLAGLGWVGKNTLLLNPELGSWFFLAALLVDVELEYDAPFETDHCGSCRACLDACPTSAFVDEYVLDASRCISYLTIERRESMPDQLRPQVGDWLFGCDVCQDVCPWNRKAPPAEETTYHPRHGETSQDLCELLELDEAAFRERFRHTPLWRPKRRGLLRNAAIVLGNQRFAPAVPALIRGLHDDEPLVRAACGWALRQIGNSEGLAAVAERQAVETDPDVACELAGAQARGRTRQE